MKMLTSGVRPDQKSLDLARHMRRCYLTMVCSQPLLVVSALAYNNVYNGVITTGKRNKWGVMLSTQGMMGCLLVTCYAILLFIYNIKVKPAKARAASVTDRASKANATFSKGSTVASSRRGSSAASSLSNHELTESSVSSVVVEVDAE